MEEEEVKVKVLTRKARMPLQINNIYLRSRELRRRRGHGGIPTYTVEVENACLSESCSISGIHLSCGWFSSARLIDPPVFRRIDYDGAPLNPGESFSFQYANTSQYPLSVSSVSC